MYNEEFFNNRILTTRWLNTNEAAAYLGITPNALRILVHRKRIEAYKLGSRLKFNLTALNAVLHKKEANYGD